MISQLSEGLKKWVSTKLLPTSPPRKITTYVQDQKQIIDNVKKSNNSMRDDVGKVNNVARGDDWMNPLTGLGVCGRDKKAKRSL